MNKWKGQISQCRKTQLNKHIKTEEGQAKIGKLHKQKTATWAIIGSKIKRQISNIMISRRFRNFVKTAQTITGWKANMQQEKQHNVIYMRICVKLMGNYRKGPKPETGTYVAYNIQGVKLYTERLEKHMELKQKSTHTTHKNTTRLESSGGTNTQ